MIKKMLLTIKGTESAVKITFANDNKDLSWQQINAKETVLKTSIV
jgi:hypothetical protein